MSRSIKRLSVASDLTVETFFDAVDELGEGKDLKNISLVCSYALSEVAGLISDETGCRLMFLPEEILDHPETWCVAHEDCYVWSPGP